MKKLYSRRLLNLFLLHHYLERHRDYGLLYKLTIYDSRNKLFSVIEGIIYIHASHRRRTKTLK